MRIQKAPINGSQRARSPTAFSKYEYLLWGDIGNLVSSSDRDTAAQTFVQRVMSPLLGSKHVDAGVCPSFALLSGLINFRNTADFIPSSLCIILPLKMLQN